LMLCVDGFSPDPAAAKRVTVPLSSAAHPNGSSPVILTLSARIGTNASGSRCRTSKTDPASGTGLRTYFDSADRPSAMNAVPTAPVNAAPVVSAGSNQTITLPAAATLSGSVKDDGLPMGATVTSTWSKTSGPGTVT